MQVTEAKQALAEGKKTFLALQKSTILRRSEPVKRRIERLEKLRAWVHANRKEIHAAAFADFSKPSAEVDGIEIFHVLSELALAIGSLERWARSVKVDAPMTMLGTRSFIQYEPRGVCLIISPWNYPFSLAAGPLISALAAGNNVVIKPSELTPNVSALIARMVKDVFDPSVVAVVEGGAEEAQHLLTLPFDHIFFTGSPAVGKMVMKAAAEHLTSVTLELGGKSPAIVTSSANLSDAAKRIAVAKFVNNGQTCVAPDYVLVDEKIAPKFIEALISQTKKLFLEKGESFEESKSYARIINEKHFGRLNDLLQDAISLGAKLEFGGNANKSTRFIHPMILTNVAPSARLMDEEIFGPILPVVTYTNLDQAIATVQAKPKALGLYVFTTSRRDQDRVLQETSAGGVCVNDCAIHFLHHNLPFGGVNNSGIGKSHGHYGFLAFSNEKPVMKQKRGWTSVQLFYPPYTETSKKIMDWFLKLY